MKKIAKIAAFAMAALMAISAAGCSSTRSIADIQKNGKLMMSTNAEFEPFEYKDGGEVVGIDIEISQKIADAIGVELEVTDIAFDSLIPALQSGRIDFIAAGLTRNEEREKNANFTDGYYEATQSIVVLKPEA